MHKYKIVEIKIVVLMQNTSVGVKASVEAVSMLVCLKLLASVEAVSMLICLKLLARLRQLAC